MIDRMRTDLLAARKRRDAVAVGALRSALAAIADAEAVPVTASPTDGGTGSAHIAGAHSGLGAAEVARRELRPHDIAAILRGEVDERHRAAEQYEALDRPDEADRLRAEAEVLRGYLS